MREEAAEEEDQEEKDPGGTDLKTGTPHNDVGNKQSVDNRFARVWAVEMHMDISRGNSCLSLRRQTMGAYHEP